MKKLLVLLLSILSIGAFGQAGSMAVSGIKYRVNDTTAYQSAVATAHAQGYADIYWNNQATTPHFDIWNGSSYDHVFDFNSGGGAGTGEFLYDVEIISGTTHTVNTAALGTDNKLFIYTNAVGCTVTLVNTVAAEKSFSAVRDTGAGTITFDDDGTSVLETDGGNLTLDGAERWVSWVKVNSTDWKGAGSLGTAASGLTVGTTTITSGTDTRVLKNTAGVLGEYSVSGTGNVAMTTSPVFTTPNIGTATGSITGNAATVTTNANLTGDVTSTGNATSIASGVIVDADVNASAAIAGTKIANTPAGSIAATTSQAAINELDTEKQSTTLTQNYHLVGNSSNVATAYPLGYVTPQMYGAVMDGATDDQAAINAALAASDYVYFLPGNYRIATTITTDDDDHLMGSGNASIISVASNIAVITIGGINNQISNLQILGSGSGAGQNGITAVGNGGFTLYRYNTRVENCFFNNLGNAGMYTINTIGNSSGSEHQGTFYAVNCRATSCAVGYLMDTRGEYNTFSNCLADDCPIGVRFNGGNNAWTGGNVVDCAVGVYIGSGTNDGHGVISGGRINHSNITCVSTATGYAFVGVEIVATSITLTSCTDIRFYNCDIASSPITSTSSVGTIFLGNCFRTTPTITVAAGNTPGFVFNTFPSGSTVHSLIVNTVQGGIQNTQQGPTSPSIETATWTTTASGQYARQLTGTMTPRATASDIASGLLVNESFTATANNQDYAMVDVNRSGTLATGGFTGTAIRAGRFRGRVDFVDLASSGAVSGISGITYTNSAGTTIFQISPDGIYRGGNAGSPWQFRSTSDGAVINNNGNGWLMSTGAIGSNFEANSTGAGTTNARSISARGGSLISSGTTSWAAFRNDATHNQTSTATGNVFSFLGVPTYTAVLGTKYNLVDVGTGTLGGVAQTSETSALSTWEVNGSLGANITATAIDVTLSATHYTVVVDASGAGRTITLPTAASSTKRIYVILNDTGTNTVTVDPNGSEVIGSAAATTYVIPATAGSAVTIQSNGTKWVILSIIP